MRLFFMLLVGVVMMTSCGESETTPIGAFADFPTGGLKEFYDDNENLVKVRVFNNEGAVLEEGDYAYGVKEGSWITYHPNGFVKTTISYVNGLKQGLSVELDNRGQLLESSTFHNNVLHGSYVKYNRSRIKEKKQYSNGVLHGLTEIFYDNGEIMEESIYENGKREGIAKWYDQEGNLSIEYTYVNGEWIKDEEN